VPNRFTACVRRQESADKINVALARYSNVAPTVYINNNVRAVKEAEVALLACKPHMYGAIIREPGFREALGGKLIISIMAGVNAVTLDNYMYVSGRQPCHIVHVMPNTALLRARVNDRHLCQPRRTAARGVRRVRHLALHTPQPRRPHAVVDHGRLHGRLRRGTGVCGADARGRRRQRLLGQGFTNGNSIRR
jgi:hypothetical protein